MCVSTSALHLSPSHTRGTWQCDLACWLWSTSACRPGFLHLLPSKNLQRSIRHYTAKVKTLLSAIQFPTRTNSLKTQQTPILRIIQICLFIAFVFSLFKSCRYSVNGCFRDRRQWHPLVHQPWLLPLQETLDGDSGRLSRQNKVEVTVKVCCYYYFYCCLYLLLGQK